MLFNKLNFNFPLKASGPPSDTTAPTVTITALSATVNVVAMQIVWSEAVTGFAVGDITISAGGSLANFATADNITFTVDWTLAAGANTMDIAEGVCTDAAGNNNTAATQYNAGYLTLQPASTDTMMFSDSPDTNFQANQQIQVGEIVGAVRATRTLIKFDLTSLPASATIASATLSIYALEDVSSNARTFRVYRQKRAWVVSQATWNIYSTGNSWQTAGGFGANDCEQTDIGSRNFTASEALNVFKDFSLTPTTKAALDLGNGWLIKADTETDDAYRFASSDNATTANRPKLVIVYYVNP